MAKKKERIKSEKKEYEQDHQWQFKFLLDQFSKESDRAAALLILFLNTPTWRAIGITSITFLIILLLVDGTAHARIENYHKELKSINR